jgi:tripartite-type tricarboxylate transporter receptor subunit TctC
MALLRRQFLQAAIALPIVSRIAYAQAYPSRPVRCIVPYPPGGPTDIAARLIGHWLSERLGQTFVMENRPGASSNLGTEAAVRASPDGHTLLIFTTAQAINAALYTKLNYKFVRDIIPVASLSKDPIVVVVNPSLPAQTIPELIAYAKANPGKINVASAGNGTTGHVVGELFRMMTGIEVVHVPYRGGLLALTDVMSGQVEVMFSPVSSAMEHIKNGKVRPLAVTTTARLEALPNIPPVNEFVPGFEGSFWSGVGAPKGTPTGIIETLNREINAALADPKVKSQLAGLGSVPLPGSSSEFGRLIGDETEKWARVIKFAGLGAK